MAKWNKLVKGKPDNVMLPPWGFTRPTIKKPYVKEDDSPKKSTSLSQTVKDAVKEEFDSWFNYQYGNKSLKERQALGAFYTPPELSIQMVEKLGVEKGKTLLDPTVGAGGLLAAAIILGKVNPGDCYGIELDSDTAEIARERLDKLGVPPYNIHVGNALEQRSYERFQKPTNAKEEKQLMEKLGIDLEGWKSLRYIGK